MGLFRKSRPQETNKEKQAEQKRDRERREAARRLQLLQMEIDLIRRRR
jgi:hypothetical protein